VGVNNSLCSVFGVVYAILTGVWSNSLVMYLVSLPKWVKRDHFVWGVGSSGWVFGVAGTRIGCFVGFDQLCCFLFVVLRCQGGMRHVCSLGI
jgi:ABC-type transporter Mla maintaining outer membrane lipid asymmetry permease subunit MlaE